MTLYNLNHNFINTKQIFVCGCPRSGTTMLGSILGSAQGCVTTPESQFKQTIPDAFCVDWSRGICGEDFLEALKKNFRFKLWDTNVPKIDLPKMLKPADYRRALLSLVDHYARKQERFPWNVWVDHTPENARDHSKLLVIFPEAQFIHIVRDPRAVAASILPLAWGPFSARKAALFWEQRISYGQALERLYPDQCIRIYYEDIVTSPVKTIKNVCGFCRIEYDDNMLTGSGFSVPTYTKKQHRLIGSKPDPSRINSWQESLDIWQIAEIEEIVGDVMELMGYKKLVTGKFPERPLTKKLAQKTVSFTSFFKNKKYRIRKKLYGRLNRVIR